MRASRTIHPGEEILDNYGYFFQVMSKSERRECLRKQYHFKCDCVACKKNWPNIGGLRSKPSTIICKFCSAEIPEGKLPKKCGKCKKELQLNKLMKKLELVSKFGRETVTTLTKDNAKATSEKYVALLGEIMPQLKYPSWEILFCQQIVSHCFSIQGNYYPTDI